MTHVNTIDPHGCLLIQTQAATAHDTAGTRATLLQVPCKMGQPSRAARRQDVLVGQAAWAPAGRIVAGRGRKDAEVCQATKLQRAKERGAAFRRAPHAKRFKKKHTVQVAGSSSWRGSGKGIWRAYHAFCADSIHRCCRVRPPPRSPPPPSMHFVPPPRFVPSKTLLKGSLRAREAHEP